MAVLSYPGAKWKAWSLIKELIPRDIKDWREPFFGGGSVSLSIANDLDFRLERMVVGDLASEVWAFWKASRENAVGVVEEVGRIYKDRCKLQIEFQGVPKGDDKYDSLYQAVIEEGREFWRWSQQVDCSKLTLEERAARFFIVNKISFSSMGDAGSISKENYIDFRLEKTDKIIEVQDTLKLMEINNVSFEETMKNTTKDSFIFLDPPYLNQERSGLYGRNGDTHRGFPHEGLREFMRGVNCRWLMTYDDSIKVRRLYKGFYIKPFKINYTMAGKKSEDALDGEEVFIANYDITENDNEDVFDLL